MTVVQWKYSMSWKTTEIEIEKMKWWKDSKQRTFYGSLKRPEKTDVESD